MSYNEAEARELVIKAGHELVASGLIARTWGNISARISDTQFIITPSGRSYLNLRPEELVVVNINDCSYDGEIKPSSEKGIHADGYRLRSDVDFIIHTHQYYATVIGAKAKNVKKPFIPCAGYGLPSTGKLRKAVASCVEKYPENNAVLMAHHGALCLGRNYEDAFKIASELEDDCRKVFERKIKKTFATPSLKLGSSVRNGNEFELTVDGISKNYSVASTIDSDVVAEMHRAIYSNFDIVNIIGESSPETVEISSKGKTLHPVVDDLAQIAGITIKSVEASPQEIAKAAKGRNAVLVKGSGALCFGKTEDDAEAVCSILKKDCAAAMYIKSLRGLMMADALIQRTIYVSKYSKKKG